MTHIVGSDRRAASREIWPRRLVKKVFEPTITARASLLNKRREGDIEIIRLAASHDKNLHAEALCRLLNVLRLILCIGICRVDQDCDWRGARHHFMRQPEPLGAQPGGERCRLAD